MFFSGIEVALDQLKNEYFETCWVIGGSEIYDCFIEKGSEIEFT